MFSEQLRKLREDKGKTQTELANELGIKRAAISNYENGNREPSIEILITFADYFNVSLDTLIGRKRDRYDILGELSKDYYFPAEITGPIPFQYDGDAVYKELRSSSYLSSYIYKTLNYLFLITLIFKETRLKASDFIRFIQEVCEYIINYYAAVYRYNNDSRLSQNEKASKIEHIDLISSGLCERLSGFIKYAP